MSIGSEWKKFKKKVKRETKRLGNQIGDETKRLGQQIGDVADKSLDILMTPGPLGKMILGGDEIDSASSDAGPLPIPDAPIGSGSPGEGSLYQKRKIVKSGRGGTILTGALVPQNVGKRILG